LERGREEKDREKEILFQAEQEKKARDEADRKAREEKRREEIEREEEKLFQEEQERKRVAEQKRRKEKEEKEREKEEIRIRDEKRKALEAQEKQQKEQQIIMENIEKERIKNEKANQIAEEERIRYEEYKKEEEKNRRKQMEAERLRQEEQWEAERILEEENRKRDLMLLKKQLEELQQQRDQLHREMASHALQAERERTERAFRQEQEKLQRAQELKMKIQIMNLWNEMYAQHLAQTRRLDALERQRNLAELRIEFEKRKLLIEIQFQQELEEMKKRVIKEREEVYRNSGYSFVGLWITPFNNAQHHGRRGGRCGGGRHGGGRHHRGQGGPPIGFGRTRKIKVSVSVPGQLVATIAEGGRRISVGSVTWRSYLVPNSNTHPGEGLVAGYGGANPRYVPGVLTILSADSISFSWTGVGALNFTRA